MEDLWDNVQVGCWKLVWVEMVRRFRRLPGVFSTSQKIGKKETIFYKNENINIKCQSETGLFSVLNIS